MKSKLELGSSMHGSTVWLAAHVPWLSLELAPPTAPLLSLLEMQRVGADAPEHAKKDISNVAPPPALTPRRAPTHPYGPDRPASDRHADETRPLLTHTDDAADASGLRGSVARVGDS